MNQQICLNGWSLTLQSP